MTRPLPNGTLEVREITPVLAKDPHTAIGLLWRTHGQYLAKRFDLPWKDLPSYKRINSRTRAILEQHIEVVELFDGVWVRWAYVDPTIRTPVPS